MAKNRLPAKQYAVLKDKVLNRDHWRCRKCGSMTGLSVHHIVFRSQQGKDTSGNLCSLCITHHLQVHGRDPDLLLTILAKSGNPKHVVNADEGLKFVTKEKK